LRSRPKRHLGLAFIAVSNHISVVVLAATPTVLAVPALNPTQSACSIENCINAVAVESDARLSLPAGHPQCEESGPTAACEVGGAAADSVPGTPAVPEGQSACPSTDVKPVPTTPAACSDTLLPPIAPARSSGDPALIVMPSVPAASLGARLTSRLELTATAETLRSGRQVVLTATASASVTSTGTAIEIFDTTSGTLIAACGQGNQCAVGYTAISGVHDFVAFITPPMVSPPDEASALESNHSTVGWLDSAVTASAAIVGRDQAVTNTDLTDTPWVVGIYDDHGHLVDHACKTGNTCSVQASVSGQTTPKYTAVVGVLPEAIPTAKSNVVQKAPGAPALVDIQAKS